MTNTPRVTFSGKDVDRLIETVSGLLSFAEDEAAATCDNEENATKAWDAADNARELLEEIARKRNEPALLANHVTARTGEHGLDKAEGCKPDFNILHVAAPCAAAAVGRRQNEAEGGQPAPNIHSTTSGLTTKPVSWLDPASGRAAKSQSGRYSVPLCPLAELERLQRCLIAAVQGNEALNNETLDLQAQLAERESLREHWLQLADVSDSDLADLMKETHALLDSDRPEWARAAQDVLTERRRQIIKGYTADHDDQYSPGELSSYAAAFALVAGGAPLGWVYQTGICSWQVKTATPRSMLVTAGALILAELERVDRETQRANIECELLRLRQMTMDVTND
ncbi:hypothetical protein [Pseudomonas putida]|nr:hypothetical protein [Pseudomonas putida]